MTAAGDSASRREELSVNPISPTFYLTRFCTAYEFETSRSNKLIHCLLHKLSLKRQLNSSTIHWTIIMILIIYYIRASYMKIYFSVQIVDRYQLRNLFNRI